MLQYVQRRLLYNSQELETTQMSFNAGTDTDNVVHLQKGVPLSYLKKNDFIKFVGNWTELEDIILRRIHIVCSH